MSETATQNNPVYYAIVNPDGTASALHQFNVAPDTDLIPAGAVAIDKITYVSWLSAGLQNKKLVNGVLTDNVTMPLQLAKLAAIRYTHEIGGFIYHDPSGSAFAVATDRDSQSKLVAAYIMASSNQWQGTKNWKMNDGTFAQLTAAQMQAIALAAQSYVSGCFDREAALVLALQTDLTTDLTSGWPSQN